MSFRIFLGVPMVHIGDLWVTLERGGGYPRVALEWQ